MWKVLLQKGSFLIESQVEVFNDDLDRDTSKDTLEEDDIPNDELDSKQ